MIEVTKEEIDRFRRLPDNKMKWDEYPFEVGEKRLPATVAYGAGQNSTAMLIGCVLQGRPIDLILFSDTGGERPDTYSFVDMMSSWLADRGYPEIIRVSNVNREGEEVTLEENCRDKDMLPSLAYGFRYKKCSQRFKIAPQQKYVNNWSPARSAWDQGERVLKYIGYDVGESHRYKEYDSDKYIYEYPLMMDWRWSREDCQDVITWADLPLPPKSACFFCPSTKKSEILKMKEKNPDLLERALQMEDAAQKNLKKIKGLAGNWSWRSFLEADEDQRELFEKAQSRDISCMCYDGERASNPEKNDAIAQGIDEDEKALPYAIEQAGELKKKAKRYKESKVDVPVEEVDVIQGSFDHPSFAPKEEAGA